MSWFKDRRDEGKFLITDIFTIFRRSELGIMIALGEWSAMDWNLGYTDLVASSGAYPPATTIESSSF